MDAEIVELSTEIRWPRFPYPGLRPFRLDVADESLIFHGRDTHRDDVATRLNSSQFVSVIGPSGCGKSSLVRVGIIPVLKAGLLTRAGYDWTPIEMRPGKDPIGNLALALASLRLPCGSAPMERREIEALLWKRRSALWMVMENFAEALQPDSDSARPQRVLLLLDQFEEIFSDGCDPRAVDQFVILLTQFFRNPHPQLFIVLTMRTDFVSQCANFPGLAEILNETQYITPVLRDQDLQDAIRLPAEKYWGEVEPALVAAIVDDMGTGSKYDADHLPLMQHALLWLWQQAWPRTGLSAPPDPGMTLPEGTPKVRLTLADYEAHGRLQGILNRHADTLFDGIAAGEGGARRAAIAEAMFRRLSERDPDGRYKRAPAYQHAVCEIAGCTTDELDEVIQPFERDASFVERRLGPVPNDPLLDLSHESLIRQWGRFRIWADDEAEAVANVRNYAADADAWVRRDRASGLLKSGLELGIFREWWSKHRPTHAWAGRYRFRGGDSRSLSESLPLVEEYLGASARRRRRHMAGFVASGALVAAALLFAGWQRYNAERQHDADQLQAQKDIVARELKVRDDVASAVGFDFLAKHEPDKALQVAHWLFASHRSMDMSQATHLAGEALKNLHETQIIDTGRPVYSLDYSRDGAWLLASASGQPQLWQIDTAQSKPLLAQDRTTYWRASWSPQGDQLLLTSQDRSTVLVAMKSDDPGKTPDPDSLDRLGGTEKVGMGVFSGDGSKVITGSMGTNLRLWDAKTHKLLATSDETVEGFWSAANVDGTLIAVPSSGNRDHRGLDIYRADANLGLIKQWQFVTTPPRTSTSEGTSQCNLGGQPMVRAMAFHPKDPDLLVFAIACRVFVADAASAKVLFQLGGHVTDVTKVAFDKDGRRIATADESGLVRIYDVPDYDRNASEQRPRLIEDGVILGSHDGTVFDLRFSPDGSNVASAGRDQTIRIWRVAPVVATGSQTDLTELVETKLPKGVKKLEKLDLCLIGDVGSCPDALQHAQQPQH